MTSATTANRARIATSALNSAVWTRADNSIPRQQIHVMRAIQATASTICAVLEFAAESQPNSKNVYFAAICASAAITITSVTTIAQPLSQPRWGPIARRTQAKVVPGSGSALLR